MTTEMAIPRRRFEPVGDVRDERDHDRGHSEQAHQKAEGEHDLPQGGCLAGEEQSGRDRDAPGEDRPHDADPVRPPTHHDSAEAESGEERRVGEGDAASRGAEIDRDGFQGDDDGIKPAEPHRHDGKRRKDPHPGIGGIDARILRIRCGAHQCSLPRRVRAERLARRFGPKENSPGAYRRWRTICVSPFRAMDCISRSTGSAGNTTNAGMGKNGASRTSWRRPSSIQGSAIERER